MINKVGTNFQKNEHYQMVEITDWGCSFNINSITVGVRENDRLYNTNDQQTHSLLLM